MLQADFNYRQINDLGEATLSVSVYANRPHIRDIMREDVESAGFFLCEAAGTDALLADPDRMLSDVILLDYPQCDAQGMAELCHFDMLAARKGSRIILSTTVDALDAVFGSFTQAETEFLVNPSRADRVIALGQLLAEVPGARVRELSEEDRLALLRMTEQVNHIARKIDGLGRQDVSGNSDKISVFHLKNKVIYGLVMKVIECSVRPGHRCLIPALFARLFANGNCAAGFSIPIFSPTQRGIFCSI